jgi:hypothetical protein
MTEIDQVELQLVEENSFLTCRFDELQYFPSSLTSYHDLQKFSLEENELFWSTIARKRLQWFHDFDQVKSGDFNDKDFRLRWFIGGKINVSGREILFKI